MINRISVRTKVGIFALFALTILALVGCGNHDQANSGTMTPAQVQQNARQQSEPTNIPSAAGTPAAPATH